MRKTRLLSLLAALPLLTIPSMALAATYYVAPGGSDSGQGTKGDPWASFSHAMSVLQPGDTLLVGDGTYSESLNVTTSGSSGQPITIQAEHDGRAVIDCGGNGIPIDVDGPYHDIVIDGFQAKSSSGGVVVLVGCSNVTVQRVTARDAGPGNVHVFDLWNTTNTWIIDSAAWGNGRCRYDFLDCNGGGARRCYGLFDGISNGYAYSQDGPYEGIQIYGSNGTLFENDVVTMTPGAYFPPGGSNPNEPTFGINVWANTYNASANDNTVVGSIVVGLPEWAYGADADPTFRLSGNYFAQSAALTSGYGLDDSGQTTMTADNMTFVDIAHDVSDGPTTADDWAVVGNGGSTPRSDYATSKYGAGAYLMVPPALRGQGDGGADVGAEILYRTENGKLTTTPLWPWPMEDRIFAELGVSVTWESDGGLWKTLDGVYPSADAGAGSGDAGESRDADAGAAGGGAADDGGGRLGIGAEGGDEAGGGDSASPTAGASGTAGCGCHVAAGAPHGPIASFSVVGAWLVWLRRQRRTRGASGGGARPKRRLRSGAALALSYNDFYGNATDVEWSCDTSSGSCSGTWTLPQFAANTSNDRHSIGADPLFISPGTDFHLKIGSPAIDAGTVLTLFDYDKDRYSRADGHGYDMGAYEYH